MSTTHSVYRLVYPDGSYRDKIYRTLGHARCARTVLASEDDLVIQALSGNWVTVDTKEVNP